jgi:hypothetical protein
MDTDMSVGLRAGYSLGIWGFILMIAWMILDGIAAPLPERNLTLFTVAVAVGYALWRYNRKMYLLDEIYVLRLMVYRAAQEYSYDCDRHHRLHSQLTKYERALEEEFNRKVPQ